MQVVHNFTESLAKSAAHSNDPMWEKVYRLAFPAFASMTCVRADGWAQRGGIDRVVVLTSGKTLAVDEKIRDKDYDDILLEVWSDEARRVPGWIRKDLACDYIAYAFAPSKRCYVLPFQQLRLAFDRNRKKWGTNAFRYPLSRAQNKSQFGNYVTLGVCIPIPELLDAVKDAMVVRWSEPEISV